MCQGFLDLNAAADQKVCGVCAEGAFPLTDFGMLLAFVPRVLKWSPLASVYVPGLSAWLLQVCCCLDLLGISLG